MRAAIAEKLEREKQKLERGAQKLTPYELGKRLCERRGIDTVATPDKHFDIYRTSARKQLRNTFFERRIGE